MSRQVPISEFDDEEKGIAEEMIARRRTMKAAQSTVTAHPDWKATKYAKMYQYYLQRAQKLGDAVQCFEETIRLTSGVAVTKPYGACMDLPPLLPHVYASLTNTQIQLYENEANLMAATTLVLGDGKGTLFRTANRLMDAGKSEYNTPSCKTWATCIRIARNGRIAQVLQKLGSIDEVAKNEKLPRSVMDALEIAVLGWGAHVTDEVEAISIMRKYAGAQMEILSKSIDTPSDVPGDAVDVVGDSAVGEDDGGATESVKAPMDPVFS